MIAAILRREPRHTECARLLSGTAEPRVVPAPVVVEVEYMCRRDGEQAAFRSLLADIAGGGVSVADLLSADYTRVAQLLEVYEDLRIGFVDASVLAIVERLGEPKLATLDHRHFAAMRPRHTRSLDLLPA